MAKQSKYMPYAQAKAAALDLQLTSRSAYQKWHRETKCEYLPLYPERAYASEWESWNTWLGTANVFRGDIDKPVRNMWDAVKWAQEYAADHNLSTMREWLDHFDANQGALPEDIPLRPDTRYVEWNQVGWPTWLGTSVRGKILAARHSTALLAVCGVRTLQTPGNYYAIVQAEHGSEELKQILVHNGLKPLRVYKITEGEKEIAMEIVLRYGDNRDGLWYVPRINDLLFDFDMTLMPWQGDLSAPAKPVDVRLEWSEGKTPTPFWAVNGGNKTGEWD